jgi:hypothetical protein
VGVKQTLLLIPGVIVLLATAASIFASEPQTHQTWRFADGRAVPETAAFIPPELLQSPQPSYPASTKPGTAEVRLEVVVGMGGRAAAVAVLASDAPELVTPAVEAAEQALFTPATLDGKPVSVRYEFRFRRELK